MSILPKKRISLKKWKPAELQTERFVPIPVPLQTFCVEKKCAMRLEPKDLYEKLEFDKILALLEKECYGALGQAAVRELSFMTDLALIERKLKETEEYKLSIEQNDHFPLAAYEDLAADLKLLRIIDYVLPEEAWKRIHNVLSLTGAVFKFFNPERQKFTPISTISSDRSISTRNFPKPLPGYLMKKATSNLMLRRPWPRSAAR